MLVWPLRFKPLQDTKQLLRQPKKRMHQYCMPQYPTCTTNARHVYGIRQTRVRHKADTCTAYAGHLYSASLAMTKRAAYGRSMRFSSRFLRHLPVILPSGRRSFPDVPFIAPANNGPVAAELYGQPHISRIAGVLWPPDVGHEDVLRGLSLGLQLKDVGALRTESFVGIRPNAGVGMLCPRPPDALC